MAKVLAKLIGEHRSFDGNGGGNVQQPSVRQASTISTLVALSAFVPTGAAGYYGVNFDILPQAVTNKSRYGNTSICRVEV